MRESATGILGLESGAMLMDFWSASFGFTTEPSVGDLDYVFRFGEPTPNHQAKNELIFLGESNEHCLGTAGSIS